MGQLPKSSFFRYYVEIERTTKVPDWAEFANGNPSIGHPAKKAYTSVRTFLLRLFHRLIDNRKPLQDIVQIALGPNIFAVYRDFVTYYSPVLAGVLIGNTKATTPSLLADIDVDVFGLFVQWMYTESLLNKKLEPAYQHRLMALWVLAKRLEYQPFKTPRSICLRSGDR